MRITEPQLAAFKTLYCDRFGKLLTDEEVLAKSLRAVQLMRLVYKPITKEEFAAAKARQAELLQTTQLATS